MNAFISSLNEGRGRRMLEVMQNHNQTESSTSTVNARNKNLLEKENDPALPTPSASKGAADLMSSFDEKNDLEISTTAVKVIVPTENSIQVTTQDIVNAEFLYDIGSTIILDSNGPISEDINEILMPHNINTSFDLDDDIIIADTLNNTKDIDHNFTPLGDLSSDSDNNIIENHKINIPQENIGNNLQKDDVDFQEEVGLNLEAIDEGEEIQNMPNLEQNPRKRVIHKNLWSKNIKKAKVNSGEEYMTKSGRLVEAKSIGESCGEKCKLRCSEKISFEIRKQLLLDFCSLPDMNRKRDFIAKLMEEVTPKYQYKKDNSNRSNNFSYFFIVDSKRFRVCKKMFTNTFCISSTFLTTLKKKTTSTGIIVEDLRGKHMNQKKISPIIIKSIFDHINSFSRIESHYCRADTKREYIDGDLDLSHMYRLYKISCTENGTPYAKKHKYEEIFNTKFNIGFFSPKKDQCALCAAYANSSQEEKLMMQKEVDIHTKEKNLSREEKKYDIDLSRAANSDTVVGCFDLEAVIQLPRGQVSTFYYKRKLNAFNFTIFDATSKQGYCFIWHEACAKRGAFEVSSFVFDFLKHKCSGTSKKVVLYSDNCTGQNKNHYLVAMYIYAVQTLDITSISHKFLIVGHTQNEGDTMHSAIERQLKKATKKTPIYVPSQLVTVVQVSNKEKNCFEVKEMDTQDVIDWNHVANSLGKNFQVSTTENKVVWADIKVFEVRKESPLTVFYKTSYDQKEFMSFRVDDKVIKKKDGTYKIKPRTSPISSSRASRSVQLNDASSSSPSAITLNPAYQVPPGISVLKKNDLLSLCESRLIPTPYHQFFNNLRVSGEE